MHTICSVAKTQAPAPEAENSNGRQRATDGSQERNQNRSSNEPNRNFSAIQPIIRTKHSVPDPFILRNAGDSSIRPTPITPNTAMQFHMKHLSKFECHEIFDYPKIYFVGESSAKIQGGADSSANYGYDDGQGSYNCVEHDHISYRYEVLKLLGKGSFGHVIKVYDHKEQVIRCYLHFKQIFKGPLWTTVFHLMLRLRLH